MPAKADWITEVLITENGSQEKDRLDERKSRGLRMYVDANSLLFPFGSRVLH